MSKNNWIAEATKNVGGLHKSLGIPQDKNIPESEKEKATHSKNSKTRKQANLALILEKITSRNKKK